MCSIALHDHTPRVVRALARHLLARHDHSRPARMFDSDFPIVIPLLLLHLLREPLLHEASGSAHSVSFRSTHLISCRSSESLFANKTTCDRHSGHSPLPARCILTRHRTQKRCPQPSRMGLNAILVQIRQA